MCTASRLIYCYPIRQINKGKESHCRNETNTAVQKLVALLSVARSLFDRVSQLGQHLNANVLLPHNLLNKAHLEQVGNETNVGYLENGCLGVLVDRHNSLAVLHTSQVLNSTRDRHRYVQLL